MIRYIIISISSGILFGFLDGVINANPLAGAVGISLLCGVVMGSITGGCFLREALIVSLYGFGPGALPIISMLGALVDPAATIINSSGDTAAAMIVSRFCKTNYY